VAGRSDSIRHRGIALDGDPLSMAGGEDEETRKKHNIPSVKVLTCSRFKEIGLISKESGRISD